MTDADTLLPCPFCGVEAFIDPESGGLGWTQICCGNDQCKVSAVAGPLSERAEAIAAWNTRAALRAQAEPFAWVDKLEWHKPAHRAVIASVKLGGWMSAALDDPAVCEAMKADIREWFSAGEPMETLGAALAFFRAQSEPVAWMYRAKHDDDDIVITTYRSSMNLRRWTETPLYTLTTDQQAEPVGPVQRCPSCGTGFQKVHDVDAHLAAIRNMKEPSHTVSEREAITAWLLSDGARLDYEASGSEEHFSWWAADAIGRGEHMKEPSQ